MKLIDFQVGQENPFFLIAGPCVIESETMAVEVAGRLRDITAGLGIPFIYKSSFDKANRSSVKSFRGPGLEEGLQILERVKQQIRVPVLTDVHENTPFDQVAAVVDVMQTPAFLCRQTNFITNVASQGKPVNIKKGQFLSPGEMNGVVAKARAADADTFAPRAVDASRRRISTARDILYSAARANRELSDTERDRVEALVAAAELDARSALTQTQAKAVQTKLAELQGQLDGSAAAATEGER